MLPFEVIITAILVFIFAYIMLYGLASLAFSKQIKNQTNSNPQQIKMGIKVAAIPVAVCSGMMAGLVCLHQEVGILDYAKYADLKTKIEFHQRKLKKPQHDLHTLTGLIEKDGKVTRHELHKLMKINNQVEGLAKIANKGEALFTDHRDRIKQGEKAKLSMQKQMKS